MKKHKHTVRRVSKRRKTFQVQVAFSALNSIYSEMFVGMHTFARAHPEMRLLGVLSQPDSIEMAAAHAVDGLVGAFYTGTDMTALSRLAVPAVNVSNRVAQDACPRVVTDDHATGRMGARHLLDCGFRCLAFAGIPGHAYSDERGAGFLAEVQASGCPCHILPAVSASNADAQGFSTELTAWLKALPRPLGLMACNDVRACHMLSACQHLRLRVPEDVAVLGVDNDTVRCRIAAVALSSVALNAERIGWLAAEMLLLMMQSPAASAKSIRVHPLGVVVRQSTDIVAAADPLVARAVGFIREHTEDHSLDIATVARNVGMSERALFRRFQHTLGWSPYQEIMRTRLNLARRLLFDTDLSIKKIASTCGFAEARELSVMYQRRFGVTATTFRRQSRPWH